MTVVRWAMVTQNIAHLENMLDLFRKMDAVSRCVNDSRDYINRQLIAARGRETRAANRGAASPARVPAVNARRGQK